VILRSISEADRPWSAAVMKQEWGSTQIISRGARYETGNLPAIVALVSNVLQGVVHYHIQGNQIEIVTLNSLSPGFGIGTALVERMIRMATEAGSRRVWLLTSNDNLEALGFYQKRGFRLVTIYSGMIDEMRRQKPSIPFTGQHQIPLRDAIELEFVIDES
jgi:ribosomal protein S18 acetylase RimI-like enzyme